MKKDQKALCWCEFMVDNKEDARVATSALAAAGYTVFVSDIRSSENGYGFGEYMISAEGHESKGDLLGVIYKGSGDKGPKKYRKDGEGEILRLEFLQITVKGENDARAMAGIFATLGRPTSVCFGNGHNKWAVNILDVCGNILCGQLWVGDEDSD